MSAAKANRQDHRDATMLLVAYRHGLRASEVCDLRWDQVDFIRAAVLPPSSESATGTQNQAGVTEAEKLIIA